MCQLICTCNTLHMWQTVKLMGGVGSEENRPRDALSKSLTDCHMTPFEMSPKAFWNGFLICTAAFSRVLCILVLSGSLQAPLAQWRCVSGSRQATSVCLCWWSAVVTRASSLWEMLLRCGGECPLHLAPPHRHCWWVFILARKHTKHIHTST